MKTNYNVEIHVINPDTKDVCVGKIDSNMISDNERLQGINILQITYNNLVNHMETQKMNDMVPLIKVAGLSTPE
jgi:hypothetical protein